MRCTSVIGIYANYGMLNKIQISKFQPSKSLKSMKKLVTCEQVNKFLTYR